MEKTLTAVSRCRLLSAAVGDQNSRRRGHRRKNGLDTTKTIIDTKQIAPLNRQKLFYNVYPT